MADVEVRDGTLSANRTTRIHGLRLMSKGDIAGHRAKSASCTAAN
jgi:hypothetical protein